MTAGSSHSRDSDFGRDLSREQTLPYSRLNSCLVSLGELLKMDARTIDEKVADLARKLATVLPEGVSALKHDVEQNFKAVLQSALARMDLVTRREFDVQASVLQRTREKLAALEQRLAQLEQQAH